MALAKRMWAARRAKTLERLVARLRAEAEQLGVAATTEDRTKALAKVYYRGRSDERSLQYQRYVGSRKVAS